MWAAVLVEQHKPGGLDERGCGYSHAGEEMPGLIWCSITGFGEHGPYATWPGHDLSYVDHSGLLTAIIPGADTYVADNAALTLGGSINWGLTKFHFANVHPTWDSYLRDKLKRLPNGPARLWVLTINEASKVCTSQFLCPDMTQSRQ